MPTAGGSWAVEQRTNQSINPSSSSPINHRSTRRPAGRRDRCESTRTDVNQSRQMRELRLYGLLVFSLAAMLMSTLGSSSVSDFYATGTALLHDDIFGSRDGSYEMKLNNAHYPFPTNPNADLATNLSTVKGDVTIYPPQHEAWLAPSSGRRRLGEE